MPARGVLACTSSVPCDACGFCGCFESSINTNGSTIDRVAREAVARKSFNTLII